MKHIHAFTLIELLVVIAIIALLLAIIAPSLAKMKTIASRTICVSNERQLVVAWLAHADENDGRFMDGKPSLDGYSTYEGKTKQCFVAVPQARDGTFRNTSLEDKIRGFQRGALWSYVENPTLFNCPSDRRWKSAPVLPPSYWPPEINSMGGYRSYSIGSVLSLGGYTCKGSAEDRATVEKTSQFISPGNKIVFLEEADQCGFNGNYWNMYLNERKWYDPFSIRHNGYSTFGYADGHADVYKWTDKKMIKMSKGELSKIQVADPDSDDYDNIRNAYIPGRYKQ